MPGTAGSVLQGERSPHSSSPWLFSLPLHPTDGLGLWLYPNTEVGQRSREARYPNSPVRSRHTARGDTQLTPHWPGTRSCRCTGRGTHRQIREGSFGSFRKPVAFIRLDVIQYFHLIFLLATARQPGPVSRPFTESPKLLSAPLSVFLPSGEQEVSRGGAHSKPT